MIHEVYDKETGAILYKKDKDTLDIEYLLREVEDLKKKNKSLEKRLKKLEDSK